MRWDPGKSQYGGFRGPGMPWWFELDPYLKLGCGNGRLEVTVTKKPLLAHGKDGTRIPSLCKVGTSRKTKTGEANNGPGFIPFWMKQTNS